MIGMAFFDENLKKIIGSVGVCDLLGSWHLAKSGVFVVTSTQHETSQAAVEQQQQTHPEPTPPSRKCHTLFT